MQDLQFVSGAPTISDYQFWMSHLFTCGCRPMMQPSANSHPFMLATSMKMHRQGEAVGTLYLCMLRVSAAHCPPSLHLTIPSVASSSHARLNAFHAISNSLTFLSHVCCRLAAKKGKGKGAKAEAGVPFKAASPMKQAPAAQAGTFYGTIGGKIPYVPVRPSTHASLYLRETFFCNFKLQDVDPYAQPGLTLV